MLWMYSWREILALAAAAIAIDWLVGDPQRLTHPVMYIGRWIRFMEKRLRGTKEQAGGEAAEAGAKAKAEMEAGAGIEMKAKAAAEADAGAESEMKAKADEVRQQDRLRTNARDNASRLRRKGALLTVSTLLLSFSVVYALIYVADAIHEWLGYALSAWLISTTIAVKGLKDAAYLVYKPLRSGDLPAARKYTGYIVGRDTDHLEEAQLTRAVVETVAENTVDAFVSPLVYALLGGAPLAMLYRASNTLDSMVGYKNETYRDFGWASARWDDVMNWLPARLTGLLLVAVALVQPGLSAKRAAAAIRRFARLHPSPNSGIPESAVAGALGIELGGLNVYGGQASERARLGWPLRERTQRDIVLAVRMLYGVSFAMMGVLVCALLWLL